MRAGVPAARLHHLPNSACLHMVTYPIATMPVNNSSDGSTSRLTEPFLLYPVRQFVGRISVRHCCGRLWVAQQCTWA